MTKLLNGYYLKLIESKLINFLYRYITVNA